MDIALNLEYRPGIPLYRQLSDSLKECITSGRMRPGDSLPSSRDLARMLGISRVTVVRCYEELTAQGFLKAAIGRGTTVTTQLADETARVAALGPSRNMEERAVRLSRFGKRLMQYGHVRSGAADLPELNYGAAPQDCLPVVRWRELLLRYSRFQEDHKELTEGDESRMGYRPLREAIASYLRRSRGMKCEAEQIAVFSGSQHALNLISHLLIDEGDRVAVENPGFPHAREQFLIQGAQLCPVGIDHSGIRMEELRQIDDCRLVYVTPSHHDPTGVVMSLERRAELLRWATETEAYIIEDDYDNEYRFTGKAVPALQGMDQCGSVIYLSTFWKVLFPIVQAGYMVVPPRLVPAVSRAKQLIERNFPMAEQLALTDFIAEGHLERHIRKTRDVYIKRRQALIFAITQHFGKQVAIARESAGMHMLVQFRVQLPDDDLIACAIEADLPMIGTSDFYVSTDREGEFIIGFASLDGDKLAARVDAFARLVQERTQLAARFCPAPVPVAAV